MHVGMLLPECAQITRHRADKRRRRGETDGQFSRFAALQTCRLFRRTIHLVDHLPGLFQEHFAGLRQADVAVVARQQTRADHLFQRLYLLAERRLRNPQALGGAAKVQLFRNGDKVTQVAQFDIHI